MSDRLDQLGLGRAVLPGQAEVVGQLLCVPGRGQRRDRDQAAVPGREFRASPYLPEQVCTSRVLIKAVSSRSAAAPTESITLCVGGCGSDVWPPSVTR